MLTHFLDEPLVPEVLVANVLARRQNRRIRYGRRDPTTTGSCEWQGAKEDLGMRRIERRAGRALK